MGVFRDLRRLKEERRVEEATIRKVEALKRAKELQLEIQKLAEELGITNEEALVYLKAKANSSEERDNGHPQNRKKKGVEKKKGVDYNTILDKMSETAKGLQGVGSGLLNMGLEREDAGETFAPRQSKGRGQRKTKRNF